jgi:hypothetical protein
VEEDAFVSLFAVTFTLAGEPDWNWQMRGFFAVLRMISEEQKQIPFGNDKQRGKRKARAKARAFSLFK